MQAPVDLLAPHAGLMFWTLVALGVFVLLTGAAIYAAVRLLLKISRRDARAHSVEPMLATVEALETEVAQLRADVTNLTEARDFDQKLFDRRQP